MKILLTSSGVSTRSLASALKDMVNKPASEAKVGFIPTAMNVQEGNKDWYVNQFISLWRQGYNWIDVVDPSAADVDWKTRLAEVDIIFVSGGNTFHLLNQFRKTGFDEWLKTNLKDKIYIGSSAGSLVATPTIAGAGIAGGDSNFMKLEDLTGLNLVNFEFMPHASNEIAMNDIKEYIKTTKNTLYAADNLTGIKIVDDKVEVISEGYWKKFS